jgi:hypothetical protein
LITRACLFGFAGLVLAVVGSVAFSVVLGGIAARPAFADAGNKPNACGCYRDSSGSCFCGKKGKCSCPGECEPKGCEEKRARDLDKEIAAETKKAAAGHVVKGKESRDDRNAESNDDSGSKKKGKTEHLTAKQKKELLHLLDAYLSEHPEGQSQTVPEVRRALGN